MEEEKDLFKMDERLRKIFERLFLECANPPALPEGRIILPLKYKKEKGE